MQLDLEILAGRLNCTCTQNQNAILNARNGYTPIRITTDTETAPRFGCLTLLCLAPPTSLPASSLNLTLHV